MGPAGGVTGQKREPNGNRLALEYLRSQCGALFRRGFQLVAHRQQLYVRTGGTKIPLRLDLTASWQQVQERCALLKQVLADSAYDPIRWNQALGVAPARSSSKGSLIELWRRRKLAEGCSEKTFADQYERYLVRLDERNPLGESSVLRVIEGLPPTSPRRRRLVRFLRQASQVAGVPWNAPLLDPLQLAGKPLPRMELPFLEEGEIEEMIDLVRGRGDLGMWRVLSCLAIYGLRPWEAWVAQVAPGRPECLLVPRGKKNPAGTTKPRIVPPFHREWIERFDLPSALRAELPNVPGTMNAGSVISRYINGASDRPGLGMELSRRCTGYAFRHAYARRIHGPRYRVTDAHGALFMGHTVAVHNNCYRQWIQGAEDPLAAYGF